MQTNPHTGNTTLTNIKIQTDKHHITKGKMHKACKLLPDNIRQNIKLRDTTRTKNKHGPKFSEIKSKITSLIQQQQRISGGNT